MQVRKFVLGTALALAWGGSVQAELTWRTSPPGEVEVTKNADMGSGHHHGHNRRPSKVFYLHDGDGAEVRLWLPTLVRRPMQPADRSGAVSLAGTGVDNYHLLLAKRQAEGRVETALRYHYLHGKPSGYSPSKLVEVNKAALELVPNPLPREHWRYQAKKPADFLLLFNGKPLADSSLTLVTSNGSREQVVSDENGRVRFVLPDDFAEVKPSRQANKPAEFVIHAGHEEGGVEYFTTYSGDYHVSPSHWRSTAGGFAAMLAGFAGGLVVIRRSRRNQGVED